MAKFIKIYNENPNPKEIDKVVSLLKKGGLIIYPTDTIYGLGCDITNSKALEKIARLKNIKLAKANLSFICNDLSHLSDYVKQIDTPTYKVLKRALPGAYTFILPGNNNLPRAFKNKKTVGIRIPDNNIIREIVKQLGNPIVSTSIRDEDDVIEYTTDPELIFEKWQNIVDVVIDGGYGGNQPSTVIDLSNDEIEIIREGKGSLDIL
ncbi:MAG: L-threonylcarbamoyladenylate synthase [Aureibaculum sp.]|nr:L-threonylcarbamoyladenylate synthase [Aureibaculum sp.]